MSKQKVSEADKRIIISARVKPSQRDTLLAVGGGNISGGLDRIMVAMERVWDSAPPRPPALAEATPNPSST